MSDITIGTKSYDVLDTGRFRSATNGFAYFYDGCVKPGVPLILKMPPRTANRRGVNDIGFAYDDGITLYATLSQQPDDENAVWQQIQPFDEINKTVCWIMAVNNGTADGHVNVNVIMF